MLYYSDTVARRYKKTCIKECKLLRSHSAVKRRAHCARAKSVSAAGGVSVYVYDHVYISHIFLPCWVDEDTCINTYICMYIYIWTYIYSMGRDACFPRSFFVSPVFLLICVGPHRRRAHQQGGLARDARGQPRSLTRICLSVHACAFIRTYV